MASATAMDPFGQGPLEPPSSEASGDGQLPSTSFARGGRRKSPQYERANRGGRMSALIAMADCSEQLAGEDDELIASASSSHSHRGSNSQKRPSLEEPNEWAPATAKIAVFRPTMEQFRNFPAYIRWVESQGAHLQSGICKIVAPPEWTPRPVRGTANYEDADGYVIKNPVRESIDGRNGVYTKQNRVWRSQMSVADFRRVANSARYKPPFSANASPEDIEKLFWSHITQHEPIYGADTEGSLYDNELVDEWNINRLGTILDEIHKDGGSVSGVTTAYLYFGMWKTSFPWHAEDMDLYSINYLHFGAPKFWYAVSSEAAGRLERLLAQRSSEASRECRTFLRHKTHFISPRLLTQHRIPFATIQQYPREFIITFPKGYHMGFNSGINCAESTNFAIDRWVDFGKNAELCSCVPDRVEIDMRPFMTRHRPKEEVTEWADYWYGPQKVPPAGFLATATDRSELWPKEMGDAECPAQIPFAARPHRRRLKKFRHSKSCTAAQVGFRIVLDADRQDSVLEFLSAHGTTFDALWARGAVDLHAEKQWNRARSRISPHCSICQYFVPDSLSVLAEPRPERSRRILRNKHLHKCAADEPMPELWAHQPDPDEDVLLECANCSLVVHPSCYPDGSTPQYYTNWRCLRCRQTSDVLIRHTTCALCELRGGAYVTASLGIDAVWVHVICALFHRRTVILPNPSTEQGSVAYVTPPRKYFSADYGDRLPPSYRGFLAPELVSQYDAQKQCELCGALAEALSSCWACHGSPVSESFVHVTCAKEAGYLLQLRDPPLNGVVICLNHTEALDAGTPLFRELQVGETVMLEKDEDGIAESGLAVIEKIKERDCLAVDFLDGSTSWCFYPTDVLSCECSAFQCARRGSHAPGAKITVQWETRCSDGTAKHVPYDAFYRHRVRRIELDVKLRDGRLLEGVDRARARTPSPTRRSSADGRRSKPTKRISSDDAATLARVQNILDSVAPKFARV